MDQDQLNEYGVNIWDRASLRDKQRIAVIAHWLHHIENMPSLLEAWNEGHVWLEVDRTKIRCGVNMDKVADPRLARKAAQLIANTPTVADVEG